MAFDTKPNLSNAKFEQFAGETLTLSGRTEIHGIIEIENSGILRLDDGNQALGKVMTSDVTGGTTWQIASITGASNGLTKSGQYVTLGGGLTGSSEIELSGHTLGISGCENGAIGFGRFYQGETAGKDLETFKASACAEIQLVNVNDSSNHCANLHLYDASGGAFILEGTSGATKTSICFNHGFTNGIQLEDQFTSMGAVYANDYSTKGILNPRWIPDYAAVTAATQTLSVGGVETSIQYNESNLLGGSADFTWNDTTKLFNLKGEIAISGTSFFRAGSATLNSIEIGVDSNSTNSDNIVIGKCSCATEIYGMGFGTNMGASASGAIMMGYNSSGLQSNNVVNSFALSFEQTQPTFLVACEGVSYLVGETDTYPKFGVGIKTPTARIHILATGATEGFRFQDGTEGLNKPLISDANGNATWGAETVTCTNFNTYTGNTDTRITNIETDVTTISGDVITNTNNITTLSATTIISITGASNGLCKTDVHNVKLGTDLTEDTTIGLGGCGLVLGSGSTILNYVNVNNLAISASPSGGTSGDGVLVWDNIDKRVKQVTQASLTVQVAQNKVVDEVNQSTHGFAVGDVIGWSGGTYNKAIADGTYSGETIGVVFDIVDTNNFRVAQSGWLTGFTGLVQGTTYFLSTSVSGGLQNSEPTIDGQISNPIMVAQSTTEAIVFPYRGQIITSGASAPAPNATVAGFDIIGDDTTTGFTVIHNFGTRDVLVNVWEAQAPYQKVIVETSLTSTNSVDVDFTIAPATGEDYRVIITY